MKKSRKNEDKRRKKSREGVDIVGSMEKRKRSKKKESNDRNEMFCLWRF